VKRLLQGLALVQVALIVALGWRIVAVWTTPLPEAGEIPELPAVTALPPPKPAPKPSEAITVAVVEHDLFDEERGQGVDPNDVTVDGPPDVPVPPPSTVKLTGVMVLGGEPVGFLLDPSIKPEQQAVRKGDMFGEYQVGDITPMGLLLLGTQSQQFQIPLKVEAAAGGGAIAPGAAPGGPPPPPRTPGTRPTPPPKPVAARPAPKPGAPEPAEAENKAMSARERAQAIAQRNAELRKQNQGAKGAAAAEEADPAAEAEANPVQARLEALRQLREAAKSR
jgi:hypothetical protein